ncbi:MAG: glycine zipper domain-containing protein [Hyphomicrobium sp.]
MPYTGAIVGGVAGAVIGDAVGGRPGRIVGAVVGAVVGGMIGSEIGRSMNEQDRRVAFNRYALGLSKGQTGQSYQWANPESGAATKYTPKQPRDVQVQSRIVHPSNVSAPGRLKVIGETYKAVKPVDIKTSPVTGAPAAMKLGANEEVTVLGRLADAPTWYFVGRGGRNIGYVSEKSLVPVNTDNAQATIVAAQPNAPPVQPVAGGDMVATVDTTTTCRDMDYEISIQGEKKEGGVMSTCKTPNGDWMTQPSQT